MSRHLGAIQFYDIITATFYIPTLNNVRQPTLSTPKLSWSMSVSHERAIIWLGFKADVTDPQVAADLKKKRTFRTFTYRGVELDKLLDMNNEDVRMKEFFLNLAFNILFLVCRSIHLLIESNYYHNLASNSSSMPVLAVVSNAVSSGVPWVSLRNFEKQKRRLLPMKSLRLSKLTCEIWLLYPKWLEVLWVSTTERCSTRLK